MERITVSACLRAMLPCSTCTYCCITYCSVCTVACIVLIQVRANHAMITHSRLNTFAVATPIDGVRPRSTRVSERTHAHAHMRAARHGVPPSPSLPQSLPSLPLPLLSLLRSSSSSSNSRFCRCRRRCSCRCCHCAAAAAATLLLLLLAAAAAAAGASAAAALLLLLPPPPQLPLRLPRCSLGRVGSGVEGGGW